MPIDALRVQQALRHPEVEVRRVALAYFARSFTPDVTILPQVFQAVEQYGRGEAGSRLLHAAQGLPQTPATVDWLVAELSQPWDQSQPAEDNYCLGLARLLALAPPELLQAEMAELVSFPSELRGPFVERLAMASWDWETAWQAMEALWRHCEAGEELSRAQRDHLEQVLEVLGRHRDRAPFVLAGLQQCAAGEPAPWPDGMTSILIQVAGQMQLTAAAPSLVAMLESDNLEVYEECMEALPRLGGDPLVSLLAERWDERSLEFCCSAAEILEDIHTPHCLATCLQLFEEWEDAELQDALGHALLGQCAEEAMEPVYDYLGPSTDENLEEEDLRYHLVATAAIVGQTFPEWDAWYQEAVENSWGWPSPDPPTRLRNQLRVDYGLEPIDPGWEPSWDEEIDEAENLSPEEYAQFASLWRRLRELDPAEFERFSQIQDSVVEPSWTDDPDRLEPIHHEAPKAGRNDPCPCGSGKKYKKCCLAKEEPRGETGP